MIPVTALIAVLVVARGAPVAPARRSRALIALAFLAISIDVNLSPRLQRGNWRDVAQALRAGRLASARSRPSSWARRRWSTTCPDSTTCARARRSR